MLEFYDLLCEGNKGPGVQESQNSNRVFIPLSVSVTGFFLSRLVTSPYVH